MRTHPLNMAESGRPHAVLVIGMHRSGTSALASALGALGLALPRPDDLLGPGFGNDAGHFESRSLMVVSEEILRRVGGAWDDPPQPADIAAAVDSLGSLAPQAARTFEDAFRAPDRAVCWKDPRSALLMGFWRKAINRPIAVVLSIRHPLEVAKSLDARNALGLPVALALWERYYRCALAGIDGLPTFVSDYADALADPAAWRASVSSWLDSLGVQLESGNVSRTGDRHQGAEPRPELPFKASLRHQSSAGEPVLGSQDAFYEELGSLSGPHASFSYTPRQPESPWTTTVLELRRDTTRLWNAMVWLGDQLQTHVPPPAPPAQFTEDAPYPLNATEDTERYHRWLAAHGEKTRIDPSVTVESLRRAGDSGAESTTGGTSRAGGPTFSVVIPCYRPPMWALERCVASVFEQSSADWEICLCDDASGDSDLAAWLAGLAKADRRVKVTSRNVNGGISAATNDALSLAGGEFVVFLDQDDELHAQALEELAAAISARPTADLVYSDEDKIDDDGVRHMPSFKPDWSPDLLLSNAYMCHVLVVRRQLVADLGGCRSEYDGAQDYDLMLRVTEITSEIVHVPRVLYHWRTLPGSASGDAEAKPWAFEAGRRALADAARRRGIDADVMQHPVVPGSYHFRRKPSRRALVSAIIPFRDEPALTAACYRSFIRDPGYDDFEILLVNNDSALPETRALLEELARDHRVRLLEAPGQFDWVRINNEAAGKAKGELLLFLNNDVEARSAGWLEAMVAQAERPDVGAVGARLLYPDNTVQHAGVVAGLGWGASHVQQGVSGFLPGYLSMTVVTRNFSAVTGACMMTRRSVFEEAGGFDTNLPIAFNDIDYCLRLRSAGLLVVYTPLAELVHHESRSRGHSDDSKELPYFRQRWRSLMLGCDPYYNPNLGRFDNNCRLPDEEDEAKWAIFLSMLNASSTT